MVKAFGLQFMRCSSHLGLFLLFWGGRLSISAELASAIMPDLSEKAPLQIRPDESNDVTGPVSEEEF